MMLTDNKSRPGRTAGRSTGKALQPIRVKFLPPTLEEAVIAARDLTDDLDGQVEIAAGLLGVDPAQVRAEVVRVAETAKQAADQLRSGSQVMVRDRAGGSRAVVVQRSGRSGRAVVVERNRFGGTGARVASSVRTRPGTIRTFDLTRRSDS